MNVTPLRLGPLLALCVGALPAASEPAQGQPGATIFATNGPVHRLRITLAEDDIARLRRNSREDVPAELRVGSETYGRVGLHLKGSTGSFRGIDDKPALTVHFSKYVAGQRFHGLTKIHLNNSVEDPSYFNELVGSELFRAAGVPAPRVTHALVELNARRLGLYVLKEGFTTEFLGLHFRNPYGNLYDTGVGHDVDEALEKDQGDGPDDGRDLIALAAAAREPDLARRWQELSRVLDMDRFVSFMAMEVIACHRDGYCLARNNFRVYHDLDADRMVFLPHGMDQLFGRPDATIRPSMAGLVARAVMETPEGRCRFRQRLSSLLTSAFDLQDIEAQRRAFLSRVRGVVSRRELRALEQAIAGVMDRIARRKQFLERELSEPEPAPLVFRNGAATLNGWRPVNSPVGGNVDLSAAPDGRPALHICAGPMTSASWRVKVLLSPGRYRFEGTVSTKAVKPLQFGHNKGAGLRVAPEGTPSSPYELVGDRGWTTLERVFEVGVDREIELICELRAAAGEAWYDLNSLRLVREPVTRPGHYPGNTHRVTSQRHPKLQPGEVSGACIFHRLVALSTSRTVQAQHS